MGCQSSKPSEVDIGEPKSVFLEASAEMDTSLDSSPAKGTNDGQDGEDAAHTRKLDTADSSAVWNPAEVTFGDKPSISVGKALYFPGGFS